ncbi:MAG: hypothetical protein AAFR38_02565 [Planctomycetota bacterium]
MLHPAPTSKTPAGVARGVLEERIVATATTPAFVVLSFYNTDYRLHLRPVGEVTRLEGKRVEGVIRAEAKRVDVVSSGGRYVEPVFGRPRRVQGSVVATEPAANTITVNAGMPIVCRLTDSRQRASDFEVGDFVSFDVLRGASFEERRAPKS